MDLPFNFILPALTYLLTLGFGLWLSKVGKPYNGILFNFHKLIALATVITSIVLLNSVLKTIEVQTQLILILIFGAVCVIGLFVTGALMSAGKFNYRVTLAIHRTAIILATLTLTALYYLFQEYI